MSRYSKRIGTLKALVAGSVIANDPNCSRILDEFDAADSVTKVNPESRRLLLELVHSARAFDTALEAFIVQRGISSKTNGIGNSLKKLSNHSVANVRKINQWEYDRYQNRIANKRNPYMHEAGSYPLNWKELDVLLSEMHSCLSRVVVL